jgi:hypothetical protein
MTLPLLPGVYLMKDSKGGVIYVGKAKALKNRVPQYFNPAAPHLRDNYQIQPEDYYIFYDDTVYGQGKDGTGDGNGGWGFDYMGIVRAVNIFNNNPDTGALIIEYLDGAYPEWLLAEVPDQSKPFFGIFYRVLNPDCVQMANAVDLTALFAGDQYHTEIVNR